MFDETGDIELPGSQQRQEGFHVPLLGPADISDGVIDAPFLVLRVVPSRTIRARKHQRKLFSVHVCPRHSHAHGAHDDHATTIPQNFGGRLSRLRRIGRRG